MAETLMLSGDAQRIGRRLGSEPYYTIAEHSELRLSLESRPAANQSVGRLTVVTGLLLLLIGLIIAVSGLVSAATGSGFAVAAFAAVLAGLIGGFGYQRMVGGYAILTTQNSISCDQESGTITFEQRSRVGRDRAQRLFFAQVGGLQLRRRPLLAGGVLRRIEPIVVLELLVADQVWIVDSATDPEALRPTAEALATILQRSFRHLT